MREDRESLRVSAEVIPLRPRQAEMVMVLERILRHARNGNIDGLAWAVSFVPGRHPGGECGACDTEGTARTHPDEGERLAGELYRKAAAMRRGKAVDH